MAEFTDAERIATLEIEDFAGGPASIDLEQERRVAVYDLLEENHCRLTGADGAPATGPYRMRLLAAPDGWTIEADAGDGVGIAPIRLDAAALYPLLSDYLAVCDSYRDAIRRLAPSQIEAIDQERRALHSEASERLRESLAGRAEFDADTARRLFTIFCALKTDDVKGV